MTIGFIGLGRMGQAMVLHLLEGGIDIVAYNRSREKTDALVAESQKLKIKSQKYNSKVKSDSTYNTQPTTYNRYGVLTPTYSIQELVKQLQPPRVIWLMVEHGRPVDEVIFGKKEDMGDRPAVAEAMAGKGNRGLVEYLEKGDVVIDGGNSFYKDSIRRHQSLAALEIHFLDVGTSGGIEGARHGACLMIGGEKEVVERLREFWTAASSSFPPGQATSFANDVGAWMHFGPAGAGHFVKMVHNGVEYGMLQAIGEGFEMLEKGPYQLDLYAVAENWTKRSVVRGWLMELLERALKNDHKLSSWEGIIGGGSTGEWTQQTAKELEVSIPVMDASMQARKTSQTKPTFSGKVVAALRNQFGGHVVEKKVERE